jgi:hypothetical protein
MSSFLLKAFSGELPRISPNLLPAGAAQSARSVRLDDGALTPLRAPAQDFVFPGYGAIVGGYKTIYKHSGTWLGWTSVVNAAPGPVATDRLYVTGDGVPKMIVAGTTYNLAVPFPAGALTAATSGAGSGDVITRVYVYTYVTDFGEESEPCPASNLINWQSGMTVTLSSFAAAPAGRNITKQRIYRTQTGDFGTDLYFIAERAASAANYTDTIPETDFAEVLPSRAYNAPPDTLAGLIAMPNGMMAAFDSANPRNLYFCQPFLPHAWPQAYVLTTDFDIVALGAIGSSLIILTTGSPYLAQGTDPSTMQMVKILSNLACINGRGVANLGHGIAYPSPEGLAVAGADGSAALATGSLFNRQEWQAFSPSTICAGQLSGMYVASYDTIDAEANAISEFLIVHTEQQAPFLARADATAQAFFFDKPSGNLYYLVDTGAVVQFDPTSGAPVDLYWKSRPMLLPRPDNMGVIQIDGTNAQTPEEAAAIAAARAAAIAANAALLAAPLGSELDGVAINAFAVDGDDLEDLPAAARSVTVGVYADGALVANVSTVGAPVRLPSGFKARKWEVDVFGTVQIEQIAVASTMLELAGMPVG